MQERVDYSEPLALTEESIAAFLQEQDGQAPATLRRWGSILRVLRQSLSEGEELTREGFVSWRRSLLERGYSGVTITNYVKCVNRYLVWCGHEEMCFTGAHAKDLSGMRFGRLTALYPTDTRKRKDVIWHCQCDCGKEADVPSSWLISGNKTSCGCRKGEALFYHNKYYDGTSIEQSMTERLMSNNTSGYTGVVWKRGGWSAEIVYKGTRYYLGHYDKIEDAAEARRRAKDRVREDAEGLLDEFNRDFPKPEPIPRVKTKVDYTKVFNESCRTIPDVVRTNNTSGIAGVSLKRGRWLAKITWQGVHYFMGTYETKEEAIRVRKGAEAILNENPENAHENLTEYKNKLKSKLKHTEV